jgi:hypothetical protein
MDVTAKLQIKPGQRVVVVNSPPDVTIPDAESHGDPADADAVIGFVIRRADLQKIEAALVAALDDRLAWVGYPKGGRLDTDLNRDSLASELAQHGVRPVRQVSLDETWSALRFRPAN